MQELEPFTLLRQNPHDPSDLTMHVEQVENLSQGWSGVVGVASKLADLGSLADMRANDPDRKARLRVTPAREANRRGRRPARDDQWGRGLKCSDLCRQLTAFIDVVHPDECTAKVDGRRGRRKPDGIAGVCKSRHLNDARAIVHHCVDARQLLE